MADYPPTPPFGMTPSGAVPPYREASHQDIYGYGDAGQPERRSFLDHKAQTRAAFEQNARIPGFKGASVAAGKPSLTIYQDQESLTYGCPTTSYRRDGTLEPPRSQNPHSKHSNPPSRELPQNIPHERNHKRPASHTPAGLNVEEGELSEGEFEEVRPSVNRNAVEMATRQDYYEQQGEDRHRPSYRGAYTANGEHDVVSNAPLTGP